MSFKRPIWSNRIMESWNKRSIVWLAGVRRTGKTTLAKSITDSIYLNCDLPSVQEQLESPENFFQEVSGKTVILDEIHQIENAAQILKIGADQFPKTKILATGSSTLVASKKFKDTLTDRKRTIHFVPILVDELPNFENKTLKERILKGGLPPALLSPIHDIEFYLEWLDSFYVRDVQEIFSVDKRQPFLKVLEFLLAENSHALEAASLAKVAGISRPTVIRYLEILEVTKAISVIRPFSGNRSQEIVSQPKVYGFDTGFCAFAQGIRDLRSEDCGRLLENLVLETIQSISGIPPVNYWRTKQRQELDFVLSMGRDSAIAIECKWKEASFDPAHLLAFREIYPEGVNFVVTGNTVRPHDQTFKKVKVSFVSIGQFRVELMKSLYLAK